MDTNSLQAKSAGAGDIRERAKEGAAQEGESNLPFHDIHAAVVHVGKFGKKVSVYGGGRDSGTYLYPFSHFHPCILDTNRLCIALTMRIIGTCLSRRSDSSWNHQNRSRLQSQGPERAVGVHAERRRDYYVGKCAVFISASY